MMLDVAAQFVNIYQFISLKFFPKNLFERDIDFIVPLSYAFIGWFLNVPWPGIELATLVYPDDTLTTWATWPGLAIFFIVFYLSLNRKNLFILKMTLFATYFGNTS